jgi:hypothetical protein
VDELIRQSQMFRDLTTVFTIWDVFLAISSSFVLALAIGYVYRATHKGVSYSQSFVQTLVIMAVVVAVIMLIIGSNIARAFSLVGALSIIRFRTAVKDPRDVAFLFFAMAVGMAAGTRFYLVGLILTIMGSAFIYLMTRFNYGARPGEEWLIKIQLPAGTDYEGLFDLVFEQSLAYHSLITVDTLKQGTVTELVYVGLPKPRVSQKSLLQALKAVNDASRVSIAVGQQQVDL